MDDLNSNSKELTHLKEKISKIESNQFQSTLFDEPQIEKAEKSYKKAFDYSIRLLSLRDYSIFKMTQKLKDRQFDEITRDEVIKKLLDLNYLREEEYTKQRTKQLIVKGYANSYIIQKLNAEHLKSSTEEIDELRENQNLSTESTLEYLIQKKLRNKEIPTEFEPKMKLKNKVINFLVSKGYRFDEIKSALSNYL